MRRRLIGFGLLILVIGVLVSLRGTAGNDSPEHSSASDGGNGTSALRYYAQALGFRTSTVEGDFSLPSSPSLLFVFTPTAGNGYSLSQAQQLRSWISAGNVVVYGAEEGDPVLDQQFGLHRSSAEVDGAASPAAPLLGGVAKLSGALESFAFQPSQTQVPLLRNKAGDVLAVRASIGSGVLVALADPHVLCNGYLALADNGRFAADILAMTPGGGSVLFDEFHHGLVAGPAPAVAWVSTGWGAALTVAVLVIFVGLAMRGRAFGPTLPLGGAADRSSAEYAAAVGGLLHRTGARSITLETLLSSTQRAVAERVGLSRDVSADQFNQVLAQRAPAAARDLAEVESSLKAGATSEEDVLRIARRLHSLAFPSPSPISSKGETQ